jgi:hypothetical protein
MDASCRYCRGGIDIRGKNCRVCGGIGKPPPDQEREAILLRMVEALTDRVEELERRLRINGIGAE